MTLSLVIGNLERMHSSVSVITAVVVTVVLFLLGYARAVWVRARRDYRTTKAAVKPLRKLLWLAIWRTLKVGAAARRGVRGDRDLVRAGRPRSQEHAVDPCQDCAGDAAGAALNVPGWVASLLSVG
jgi:hypothetical protein